MDREVLTTVRQVADPRVAPRLLNPKVMHYLGPFLGRESTLSAAAAQLGVSLPRLHYQVRRGLEDGLLEVVRTERRGGQAVRVYCATAAAFFVPFEAMKNDTVEAAHEAGDGSLRRLYFKNLARLWREHPGRWGVLVSREDDGWVTTRIVPHPEGSWTPEDPELPAVMLGGWVTDLALDFGDAKALQRELGEVLRRYLGRGGSQRYLFQVRLAPLLEEPSDFPKVTSR